MVMPVFDRGDVVNVPLDPAVGHEQKGTRPALVLTTKEFNQLGDVLVAPVTQGGDFSRYAGFAVSLTGTGCKTQGVALINKIRMLDLTERQARKIERVPQEVLDDALGRLVALLDC
nr:type II toxin-antitoxin system ChpB family toxin [Candidatus Glomeribacter gigasporarum]